MLRKILWPVYAEIRMQKANVRAFRKRVVEHFRIIGHDRTVIVIIRLVLVKIIRKTWIEDRIDPAVDKHFQMSVHQLGRIAHSIAWDRVLTVMIHFLT